MIYLQRKTTVLGPLDTVKGVLKIDSSSDEAGFDSDKETKLRSMLVQPQQAEFKSKDPVEQALRRGISLQHPLPIPRQVSRFTLKPIGPDS